MRRILVGIALVTSSLTLPRLVQPQLVHAASTHAIHPDYCNGFNQVHSDNITGSGGNYGTYSVWIQDCPSSGTHWTYVQVNAIAIGVRACIDNDNHCNFSGGTSVQSPVVQYYPGSANVAYGGAGLGTAQPASFSYSY